MINTWLIFKNKHSSFSGNSSLNKVFQFEFQIDSIWSKLFLPRVCWRTKLFPPQLRPKISQSFNLSADEHDAQTVLANCVCQYLIKSIWCCFMKIQSCYYAQYNINNINNRKKSRSCIGKPIWDPWQLSSASKRKKRGKFMLLSDFKCCRLDFKYEVGDCKMLLAARKPLE